MATQLELPTYWHAWLTAQHIKRGSDLDFARIGPSARIMFSSLMKGSDEAEQT
ncbi:hypothetical protein NKG99_33655 [Mesorhizobium sp. M1409]|uniref:hypothetical protein n=1 Tax=Mesorhizobium sp. M1409 TaxID=2957100 RepID=UPI00333DF43A